MRLPLSALLTPRSVPVSALPDPPNPPDGFEIFNLIMAGLSWLLNRLIIPHWPLLVVAAVAALAVGALLAVVISKRRLRVREQAAWVQITPPSEPRHGQDPSGFWRGLDGLLSRNRMGRWFGRRLSVELVTDPVHGTRLGVWVPPSVPAAHVTGVARRAFPDASIVVTAPPEVPESRPSAKEYRPSDGVWSPLAERVRQRSAPALPVPDAGTALLQMLHATADHTSCVQLVVRTHRGRGDNVGRGILGRVVGLLARLLTVIVRELLDLLTPGANTPRSSHPAAPQLDPVTAARQRAISTKKAQGVHLAATLRVACYGRPLGDRTQRVEAIAGAFDAAAEHSRMRYRRVRHPLRRSPLGCTGASSSPPRASLRRCGTCPTPSRNTTVSPRPSCVTTDPIETSLARASLGHMLQVPTMAAANPVTPHRLAGPAPASLGPCATHVMTRMATAAPPAKPDRGARDTAGR